MVDPFRATREEQLASGYLQLTEGADAPALARALGDMILVWTDAEERQMFAFASMLGLNPDVAATLYQKVPNFRSKTNLLQATITMMPRYENIAQPVKKLSTLSLTRNRYVHCTYLIEEAGSDYIRSVDYGLPEDAPRRSIPVKASDIGNHCKSVKHWTNQLERELAMIPEYQTWLAEHLPDWV